MHVSKALLGLLLLPTLSAHAGTKCPTLVREPKHLNCQSKINYYGLPFQKVLRIDLQPDGYQTWSGKVEFQYPGVGNGDNAPNTLNAKVWIETHGNSPCQQWNESEFALDVLSYKITGIGKSLSATVKDSFEKPALSLEMNCSAD